MAAACGVVETPWGFVGIEVGDTGLRRVTFDAPPAPVLTGAWADALAGYLTGIPIPPALPVDLADLSPFARRVLNACRMIPYGTTMSYAELAFIIGSPRAARAVGGALARNPVPIVIPCHRVIGAHGGLTGFRGGLTWKRQLLRHEGKASG